jgi:hypothetical protein
VAAPLFAPPVWSDDELDASRRVSEQLFTQLRRDEGPRAFARVAAELRPRVEAFMRDSDYLRRVHGDVFRRDPSAWQAARYFVGPPISQEDLWTMVGGSKFRSVPPTLADDVAEAIVPLLDAVRYPWLLGGNGEGPTVEQLEVAVVSTTLLWAAQQLGTDRRGEASRRQELEVADALSANGMTLDPSRSAVTILDAMARGTFSRERALAGAKCDIPIRLIDGRLLALECKVSNGPKNGWKRVNREVGGKAESWRVAFGNQVMTGVVLAGSFDLRCLTTAQDKGVTIFWQHELNDLIAFVNSLS